MVRRVACVVARVGAPRVGSRGPSTPSTRPHPKALPRWTATEGNERVLSRLALDLGQEPAAPHQAVLKCLKDDRCADHHTDWDKFLPKRGGCTNNEPTCLNKDGEKVSIKDCCPPICQQCMK